MLQVLRIRDLALLDHAELEFGPGFVAVTGETGAGKSVLLGALALLAGDRADRTLVRQGADRLEVEGVLHLEMVVHDHLDAGQVLALQPCRERRADRVVAPAGIANRDDDDGRGHR